ncbi:MAG TPA: PIG-L family deacetylase [Ktedonobacteraceae bacterium]|nr:PIG-L family deacetylase [Ktedonobacteraceae bacterium]
MSTKRLLGVFAHPDDEGFIGGALLYYHSLGVETGLVYATRGEVGEIFDPVLATPENLGQVREAEMRAAADVLGVQHLWFLSFRDSGMTGTPANDDPRALINAGAASVIGELVAVIRKFRPQVMVTFDETGGFGHPDHMAIYRNTVGAFHAAADAEQYPEAGQAHAVSKLYYSSYTRWQFVTLAEWVGQESEVFKGKNPHEIGIPDDKVSVLLDVGNWQDSKARARALHRTQINPNNAVLSLPEDMQRKWRSTEFYQLAASRVGPDVMGENDLFARVL